MRYAKYIEPGLSIAILICMLFYLLQVLGKPSLTSIIALIAADLLVKISFRIYLVRLLSQEKIVVIKEKKAFWTKLPIVIFSAVLINLVLFGLEDFKYELANNLEILLLIYISLSALFFSKSEHDFYIDSKGFIQPEFLKKNYSWKEIDNFKLTDGTLEFSLKDKEYNIAISDEIRDRIANLKIHK